MSVLDGVAARVAGGETVRFRPSGASMVPLIRSRQLVTVAPVDPSKLAVGDIVLARVAGTVYLHLVSSLEPARKRVQISNNRGHVNGWTGHDRVFGICVAVDGTPRPGAATKVRAAGPTSETDDEGHSGSGSGSGSQTLGHGQPEGRAVE
ncbi:S26 family signal peptidase [Streptomyces sp. NPDC051920]|uniref:S26 family signal peptidase n=1 Tax=Streptomyces sp. NPDC051920 TaxID=3155523 RepID=UPI00342648C2